MNKFIASALLALVAVAAATSVPAIYNPTDEQEIAPLKGEATQFADYCLKQRDYIVADIKANATSAPDYLAILENMDLFNGASLEQWGESPLSFFQGPKPTRSEYTNILRGVCADFLKYEDHTDREFEEFNSEHKTSFTDSREVECLTTNTVHNVLVTCVWRNVL